MTIDEAIIMHKQKAASYHKAMPNYGEAAYHRQLAEWLTELKDSRAVQNEQEIFIHELMSKLEEAKRLLKAAVEGYSFIGHITKDYACPSFTSCSACPMDEGKQCKIWKHEAEALKLIGGETDEHS